jgi:hypothetical protein
MKFSDLLGDPEPEPRAEGATPATDAEPISVFAPEPAAPPAPVPVVAPNPAASPVSRWADNVVNPTTGRSGLAELNVRQPPAGVVAATPADGSVSDQLIGLTEIVDDLLPSGRRRK